MKLSLLFCCVLSVAFAGANTIRYVTPNGSDANTGLGWAQALKTLQVAINASASGDEVWVMAGVYKPTTTNGMGIADRTISFAMKLNVSVYGGFNGTETLFGQRNVFINETILSGDVGFPGSTADNSYHVVVDNGNGGSSNGVLDGFTISNGNANGSATNSNGGGMYATNTTRKIISCIFTDNIANTNGGGLYGQSPGGEVSQCSFIANSAANGGGYYDNSNLDKIENCLFMGNTATTKGGALMVQSLTKVNACSFSGNSSPTGGAIFATPSGQVASMLVNSIVWGNSSAIANSGSVTMRVLYSIIQGGYTGGTAITTADPLFVDQPVIGLGGSGDLHLQAGSPAIGTADSAQSPDGDLENRPKGLNGGYEQGCYEYEACPFGGTLYVNAAATGANNGSSWANAYTDLQLALTRNYCPSITAIWVAAGTYKPTSGTSQFASFSLKNGMAIYGGFNGTETDVSERDWLANQSILSGDLAPFGSPAGNVYHVVDNRYDEVGASAILDGFTITGGYAPLNNQEDAGAGMINADCSPTISNCRFTNNYGNHGGGMYNENANPTVTNCRFDSCSGIDGGGMYNLNASPIVTNSVFLGNKASRYGGGIYGLMGSPVFINCSLSGNQGVTAGGAMYNASSTVMLTNCIVWGNNTQLQNSGSTLTATYSTFQGGGVAGAGNVATDPLFVTQPPIGVGAAGDLRLQPCSPAINLGVNSANTTRADPDNNPRIVYGTIDMGAYETISSGPPPTGSGTYTRSILSGDTMLLVGNCKPFGQLRSTGIRPVTGSVTAKYWVDGTIPVSNGKPYVARHFELAPVTDAQTASGRSILYFTQAEFNAFNSFDASDANLPTSPTDRAGISHLRVYRFGGTSASGAIANYPGGISTIDPALNEVVWNAASTRWEVSFSHTGSGGFFIGTDTVAVLCSGMAYPWFAATAGTTYQWQSLVGGTWTAITGPMFLGATSATLQSTTSITSAQYGLQIRCLVNGVATGRVYRLEFASTWFGTSSNVWGTAANWGCGAIPNSNMDVYIGNNVLTFPKVTANTSVRSLRVLPGARVDVNTGVGLLLTGE